MKKSLSVIFAFLAIVLMMIIPSNKAFAAQTPKVLTIEASQESGVIKASGTTERGVLAVAVAVYTEDGSKALTMKTTDVNNNNEYSTSIEVPNGNYIVRAANYDGGEFVETKITVDSAKEENEKEAEKESSPKTGDSFIIYGVVLGVAAIALIAAVVVKNKKSRK